MGLPVLEFLINGIISLFAFVSSFFGSAKCFKIHPCCYTHQPSILFFFIIWIYHTWFIHSPIDGHLNCFQFSWGEVLYDTDILWTVYPLKWWIFCFRILTVLNERSMNIFTSISHRCIFFSFIWDKAPRNGIAGFCDRVIVNFIWKRQLVL